MTHIPYVDYFDHKGLFPNVREYKDDEGNWWRCTKKNSPLEGYFKYSFELCLDDGFLEHGEYESSETNLKKVHVSYIHDLIMNQN